MSSGLPAAGPPQEDLSRPLVDAEALERWLDQQLGGPGRLDVERHQAGHSCETFFVSRGGRLGNVGIGLPCAPATAAKDISTPNANKERGAQTSI